MEEVRCFLSHNKVLAQLWPKELPPNTDTDLNFWFSINVYSAVVDHFHDGYSKIAPNPKGNAEAQPTHNGNEVALGKATAVAAAEGGASAWKSALAFLLHSAQCYLLPHSSHQFFYSGRKMVREERLGFQREKELY